MRNLIRYCIALVLLLLISTPAHCKELYNYASGNIGIALHDKADVSDPALAGAELELEFNPGYCLGLAIGHQFVDKNFRAEGEFGLQTNTIDKVNGGSLSSSEDDELRLITLLFNLYYDFKNSSAFTPYLCAGVGLGNMKIDGADEDDAVTAIQFGTGVAFQISDKLVLDLKLRHLETSDGEFGSTKIDYSTNNAIFCIRGYF